MRYDRSEDQRYNQRRGRSNSTRGSMSTRDAGRMGGEAPARTHGRDFYEDIGRRGGQNRWAQDDDEY